MIATFDDWYSAIDGIISERDIAKFAWEAGQESRQAEIDAQDAEIARLRTENEKLKSASYTVLRTTPYGMMRVECHSCQTHYWVDSDPTKVE